MTRAVRVGVPVMWAHRTKGLPMRELSKTATSGDIDKTVIIRQASNDRQKMKLMILIKGVPKNHADKALVLYESKLYVSLR